MVVAVSGGSDSVALTLLMAELSAAGVLHLAGLAHLNHGLRGAESDATPTFCASLAAGLRRCVSTSNCVTSRRIAAGRGRSLEEAAREARYAFLERVRQRRQADVVAVGHTRDDQAETVLLRLVRGAGREVSRRFIRAGSRSSGRSSTCAAPSWSTTSSAHGRTWRVDDSNQDRARRRNRLRHDVLPALVASEGASVVTVLARTAEIAAADEALLAALARDARARVVVEDGAVLRLKYRRWPRSRWRCAAGWCNGRWRACRTARPPLRTSMPRCDSWSAAARPCWPRATGRWNFLTGRGSYLVGSAAKPARIFWSWQYRLCVPGELVVPEAGIRLQALVSPVEMAPAAGTQAAILDLPAPADDLVVRAWQAGDRMRLSGGSGRKKVQDVFVDRKVPRADRHRVPIVTAADGRIIWVLGHELAGGFGVTDATKSVVVLSFEPLGGN